MTKPSLARRQVVQQLLDNRRDLLVVSGLGASSWDVASASDHSLDFTLWGAMGGAAMVGLGLALAQPQKKVLVLTGDGEQLMGLGALATIGVQKPPNLRVVVLDNERYGETGQQQTHTAFGVDLAAVARDCGFPYTCTIHTLEEGKLLKEEIYSREELFLAVVKVAMTDDPMKLPPRDGTYLKNRFRQALLGSQAVYE